MTKLGITQPTVSLIYLTGLTAAPTGKGVPAVEERFDPNFAAALLAFTKNTRLNMSPDGFVKFITMDPEELQKELDYMVNTIRSSWEFVDVIFMIENVSRACAQQITRTRTASFAMQSQRVTDMTKASHHVPKRLSNQKETSQEALEAYEDAIVGAMAEYQSLVEDHGLNLEDARGVLPINLHCNLVAKYNLRTLVDVVHARESMRAQGEYRDICAQMKAHVIHAWPWSEKFFWPKNKLAVDMLQSVVDELPDGHQKMNVSKAMDMIKNG